MCETRRAKREERRAKSESRTAGGDASSKQDAIARGCTCSPPDTLRCDHVRESAPRVWQSGVRGCVGEVATLFRIQFSYAVVCLRFVLLCLRCDDVVVLVSRSMYHASVSRRRGIDDPNQVCNGVVCMWDRAPAVLSASCCVCTLCVFECV